LAAAVVTGLAEVAPIPLMRGGGDDASVASLLRGEARVACGNVDGYADPPCPSSES
jgi:hypothetical protein